MKELLNLNYTDMTLVPSSRILRATESHYLLDVSGAGKIGLAQPALGF